MPKKQKKIVVQGSEKPHEPTLEDIRTLPLKKYPIEAKSITAKTLHNDLKMDIKRIADIMGMGRTSIYRFLEMPDIREDSEWSTFREVVKRMFESKRSNLYARVLHHLESKLPEARFYEAAGLAKILQDADREDTKVGVRADKAIVFQVTKDTK